LPYTLCSHIFSEKSQRFVLKITLNSNIMIDFDKIGDLSFMIEDYEPKKIKKAKKYGKKSSKHRKRIKKNK